MSFASRWVEAPAHVTEAEPGLPICVGGRCAEVYPAVSAAVGAQTCTTARETLAFLEGLRPNAGETA